MQWFGTAHGAPYEDAATHIPTPVGERCAWCGENITEDDDGFSLIVLGAEARCTALYHYECQVRLMAGGLNHMLGRCSCCGGTEPPDPPGLSLREAARLAVDYFTARYQAENARADRTVASA